MNILDYFPNGWTPSKLQAEVLIELALRWESSQVFILKLDVASGKCLKKGTKVRMYDGSSKAIEAILPGEKVMGPDSKPRLVLNTCQGVTDLYKIIPKRGESYSVTHNHTLALKVPTEEKVNGQRKVRQRKTEITVTDFLQKSSTFQKQAKQYQATVEYSRKNLKVDPYILGVWLGDGDSGNTTLTTMDTEIRDAWLHESERRGLSVRREDQKGKSDRYFIRAKGQATALNRNTLKYDIASYGLFWNKHIPQEYLTASREQRLQLFAGLVDTDGHVNNKLGNITFCLSNQRLLSDLVILARSLGFSANIGKTKHINGSYYFRCHISGTTIKDTPVRLKYKTPTNSKSDQRNCSFSVEYEGKGEYAGIEVDGDHLYLLDTFVVTHNSAVATCIAKWVESKGGYGAGARICTPTNVLVNQYTSLFPDLAVTKAPSQYRCETRQTTCGAYSAKLRCKGCVYNKDRNAAQKAPVSVSTYHMTKALYGSRKLMIFDEAHNLSKVIRDMYSTDVFAHKAEIPQYVVGDMDATHRWLLGLSAHQLEEMHPVLQDFAKDLRSDSPLNFYGWSTKLWSGGGEAWGEKLVRSEPEELPVLEQQPLDIFTKPSPFWDANQKLVLMSATVGRHDLYELGLDRVRPIFIEGDPPITTDRNPIIKDYIGSISHSNIDKRVPEIAAKILEYLNTRRGKGVIHVTYGLAEKLKPLLEHERLITHTASNMRAKLKEFKESSNGVFMASGMYEGVSLDYDLARWQVIAKIVWPSLLDPLQKHRSSIDPDFYLWSTMKTVIQASGRVCRREDDFGETIIWDTSFERLLNEGAHLVPKSFINRIKQQK